MSKDKAKSKIGGDNALSDDELANVAGGGIKFDGVEGESTHKDHKAILRALRSRDEAACVELLQEHIARRLDQIIDAIKERMTQILVTRPRSIPAR